MAGKGCVLVMNSIADDLYESFKTNLESVNGMCTRASKADLAKVIVELYKENEIPTTSIAQSPLLIEVGVAAALQEAGVTVHTDHIRLHAETDKGGISEAQHGIAELGTIVQEEDDADGRMVSTMSEYYIGVLKGSSIVPTYDEMFDILSAMPEIPNFVGFVTGPSRTADIECVGTVGVHGPIQLCVVVVDDE